MHVYFEGYIAGYRDGLQAAASGKELWQMQEDIRSLPIKSMDISTRAVNCLSRYGCSSIGDAANLSAHSILTMRNMGAKTASEIARWLNEHGICGTAWQSYL